MSGMLVAGRDANGDLWAVETVELDLVPRRTGLTVGAVPTGPGAWLLIRKRGMVEWRRSVDDLAALGIDIAAGQVVRRWA